MTVRQWIAAALVLAMIVGFYAWLAMMLDAKAAAIVTGAIIGGCSLQALIMWLIEPQAAHPTHTNDRGE